MLLIQIPDLISMKENYQYLKLDTYLLYSKGCLRMAYEESRTPCSTSRRWEGWIWKCKSIIGVNVETWRSNLATIEKGKKSNKVPTY